MNFNVQHLLEVVEYLHWFRCLNTYNNYISLLIVTLPNIQWF